MRNAPGDRQVALEEARQRMHALLDDAFALIAPTPPRLVAMFAFFLSSL